MADQGRWFKLWCSAVYDPGLDNLEISDFGRWAKLGAIIKEQGEEGKIILTEPSRSICSALQISAFQELILCIQKMPNVTVSTETSTSVSYTVEFKNWHKYQGDFSTNRVRKFRAKKHENETPKRRGEEKRGEENKKRGDNYKGYAEREVENCLKDHLETFKKAYPGIDVITESAKALAWLISNPKNQKSDIKRFLNNWFNRTQNKNNLYPPREERYI